MVSLSNHAVSALIVDSHALKGLRYEWLASVLARWRASLDCWSARLTLMEREAFYPPGLTGMQAAERKGADE